MEAEDVAELATALQDELSLALAEAENLFPLRKIERRNLLQAGEF